MALPETNDVIRRFNRDTRWLAALVVGAVVSAALILAVVVQDRHPRAVDFTQEAVQGRGDLLLNAKPATLVNDRGLPGKKSTGEITPGLASPVGHASAGISPEGNPGSQTEAASSAPTPTPILKPANPSSEEPSAASTPAPVLALVPEINEINAQADASSWSPVARQDPVHSKRVKILRYRSSVLRRPTDVRTRLIALWHQSLARSERARTWTAYSNLKRGVRKKAAYTAETNH